MQELVTGLIPGDSSRRPPSTASLHDVRACKKDSSEAPELRTDRGVDLAGAVVEVAGLAVHLAILAEAPAHIHHVRSERSWAGPQNLHASALLVPFTGMTSSCSHLDLDMRMEMLWT